MSDNKLQFDEKKTSKEHPKKYASKVSKSDCKLAYMAGENDRETLCKIGNCHVKTLLESWLPEFEKEKKEMILGFSDSSFQLGVTEAELAHHLAYIRQLRTMADQYKTEVEDYDRIRNSLNVILEQLEEHSEFDEKDFKQICSLLNIFVTSKKAYDTSVAQYVKITKEWTHATGVEAHHNAASARIKEAERLRGKDDAGRDMMMKTDQPDELIKKNHNNNDFGLDI